MSTQAPNPLSRQQENRVEERDEGEGDEEEEEEGRIVPQLKIGKDGSIILDEERWDTLCVRAISRYKSA